MSGNAKMDAAVGRCPKCGGLLPRGISGGPCPACLLKAGLETEPVSSTSPTSATAHPAASKGAPRAGDQFGSYRLIRALGGGGMGLVYEAEEMETGRRVALKLLSQKLDSPEARKRFLREGQLAAAINHPNCVYVYGTIEIAGTPAISMELMAGGTLQDRVAAGPLKIPEAVDAILQVIAGLEAARRAGILHRDVKPSNCFIGTDGMVKVGDFGLSISTSVRTEPTLTATGIVMGTPAFSSPEQLRGDELTVRADIYSVGATLYYLLTGKTPFQAANLVQMLATVLEKRPDPPIKWRADIPVELSRVILKCLQKDAGERYSSYGELQASLLPFSSAAPRAATLGRRFLAGFIDLTLIGGIAQILESGIPLQFTPFYPLVLLYFTVTEGWTGKSLGKKIVGIKIVCAGTRRFGFFLAFARVALFATAFLIFDLSIVLFLSQLHAMNGAWAGIVSVIALSIPLILLFSTARRQNSWRGIHDLLARTRVVMEMAVPEPEESQTDRKDAVSEGERVGPYHLLERLGATDQGEIFLGYDPRLLRKVWIHKVPPGTAAVNSEVRSTERPARLRWLAGRRSGTENWDAYEGVGGMALLGRIREKKAGWSEVRFWLLDLATELNAATNHAERPELKLSRIWITDHGRVKLVDFNAPSSFGTVASGDDRMPVSEMNHPGSDSAHEFLLQVAASSLCGRQVATNDATTACLCMPLPMHARNILESIRARTGLPAIIQQLKDSLTRPVIVTRTRRLLVFLSALWAPIFLTVLVLLADRAPRIQSLAELARLEKCLARLDNLPTESPETRNALEICIAGTFAATITNSWAMAQGSASEIEQQETEARRILERHPKITQEQLAAARQKLNEAGINVEVGPGTSSPTGLSERRWTSFVGLGSAYGLLVVILPCWVAALAFRGGPLLRGFGLAVVKRDGSLASRGRVFWRNLIATVPFVAAAVCLYKSDANVAALPLGIAIALGTASALMPGRTMQDRLAGTDLVIR